MTITKIRKRDGRIEEFSISKIASAVHKALNATETKDGAVAHAIAEEVTAVLSTRFANVIPSVENIQDIIEDTLMKHHLAKAAKAYILYRQQHAQMREAKRMIGVPDELKLGVNAVAVLERRYLMKNEDGKVIETPSQLFRRVARAIASVDKHYDDDAKRSEEIFYELMAKREFMPNTPTLMNAGAPLGQLSACFVLPVEDSLKSIFKAVSDMATIQQSGGGTGFSFSQLRPKNDLVRSTKGVASGPVSFMRIFDVTTDTIKQGGRRRGANMGVLRVDHPDVMEFITAKSKEGFLANFNLSVAVTDTFMHAVQKGQEYDLINPRTHEAVKRLRARDVWDLIVTYAWRTGDPGIIFIDEINRTNATSYVGAIDSTNPCVTGDTKVFTKEGINTIKALAEIGSAEILTKDGKFSSSRIFKTGAKEVFKLTTKEGYSVKLTADHKVLTQRGWIEAKDLCEGDNVHISKVKGGFGSFGTLEEGQMIGWLIGDGFFGDYRACLDFYGEEKQELAPYFEQTINERFYNGGQDRYSIGMSEIKSMDSIRVRSKRLMEFADKLGLVDNKLQIPVEVFSGSEWMQRGLLQALFTADGSMQGNLEKGLSVRLAQSDRRLLEDVQTLLLNFGIFSKLYKNRRKEGMRMMPDGRGGNKLYKTKPQHELVVSKESMFMFAKEIGFLTARKQNRLTSSLSKMSRRPYKERPFAIFERLEKLEIEDVYDINEPETHSFIANGLVVHNCGEQPLHPYESCNLGSINLTKMLSEVGGEYEIDWEKLRVTVHNCVHFLDNVIDANRYPLPEIEQMTKANRRIGLGVMGFADMLLMLGIPYNSDAAVKTGEKIMKLIEEESHDASAAIAEKRGSFPNFKGSIWDKRGFRAMRNATCTTIAPTGTISIIAGCSSGIEPLFAVTFVRNVLEGTRLLEVNHVFEQTAKAHGFYSQELMQEIARSASIQRIEKIPADVRKLFVTAHDIGAEWHVRMQSAFQKHTDNAVSKTINFPHDATADDVRKAYELAYKLKCKGITVYRYGSKREQVLYIGAMENAEATPFVTAESEYAGGCPTSLCPSPA